MKQSKIIYIILSILLVLLFFGYRNYKMMNEPIKEKQLNNNTISIIDVIENEKIETNQRKLNENLKKPFDIDYSIIRTNEILDEKFSIDIRLKKAYRKSEIKKFAYYIKNEYLKKSYKRIFITYYLPKMKVGEGAWCTSHFNPDLEIFMTSPFYDDSLKEETPNLTEFERIINEFKKNNKKIKIIGFWNENKGFLTVIFKKNKKYYLSSIDKSTSKKGKDYDLIVKRINGEIRYIIKELLYPDMSKLNGVKLIGDYTDYYLIEKNGDLSIYDKVGIIERYKRIKD